MYVVIVDHCVMSVWIQHQYTQDAHSQGSLNLFQGHTLLQGLLYFIVNTMAWKIKVLSGAFGFAAATGAPEELPEK